MRNATLGGLLVALALGLIAPAAHGHAQLRSSGPSAGERVQEPPRVVSLTFTEPPELSLSSVRVLDSEGESWEEGEPQLAPGDEHTLEVPLGDLPDDVYTVTWRTVSKVDGHATAGTFAFGVGVSPAGVGEPGEFGGSVDQSPDPWLEIVGRWLFLAGVVFAAGAAAVGLWVMRAWPPAVSLIAKSGLAVAFVGAVILGLAQLHAADSSLGDFLATRIGRAALLRSGALIVAGGGFLLARPNASRRDRVGPVVALVAVSLAMYVHVDAGHASADPSWTQIAAQWLHFAAVSVWIGGLASLLVGTRGAPSDDNGRAVARFSMLAGVALGAVALAGVYRAINELDGWSQLYDSTYGRVVTAKIALLLGLAGLGAINRYRNVPAADRDLSGLRRIGRAEVVIGALVVLLAAGLASVSPPGPDEALASRPEVLTVTGADFGTSVRARLEVDPGFAGVNGFNLSLRDYDSGEPVHARATLRFSFLDGSLPVSELKLTHEGSGRYAAEGANLSLDGRWRITAVIQEGSGSVEIPLEVATRCDARRLAEPGRRPIWILGLDGDNTVQAYFDPGTPGHNDVHLTFFASDGTELKVAKSPVAMASTEDGGQVALEISRFSPGHFVATGHFDAGTWRVAMSATIDGRAQGSCFEEAIE